MDYNRIKILLGEHLETISSHVGPENLDRFFFMSLPRLRKIAETHPDLQKQIERVLNHYGRDISGYSV